MNFFYFLNLSLKIYFKCDFLICIRKKKQQNYLEKIMQNFTMPKAIQLCLKICKILKVKIFCFCLKFNELDIPIRLKYACKSSIIIKLLIEKVHINNFAY